MTTQDVLEAYGARGLTDARERALEYRRQLDGMSAKLRRDFLNMIQEYDPDAWRLMKSGSGTLRSA